MSVAFLFPLTWVQRERQRETSEECVWWWVTPGRSRSVGGLCDCTCPAPGSGPGHCDLCLLLPAESPPGCCSLPISLGYTECIHSRSVIEFHTCHSQLYCVFHKGARAAWKKWKKNHLDLLRSCRRESGYSAALLHSSATDAEIIGVIWNIKSVNVFRGMPLTWPVCANTLPESSINTSYAESNSVIYKVNPALLFCEIRASLGYQNVTWVTVICSSCFLFVSSGPVKEGRKWLEGRLRRSKVTLSWCFSSSVGSCRRLSP